MMNFSEMLIFKNPCVNILDDSSIRHRCLPIPVKLHEAAHVGGGITKRGAGVPSNSIVKPS